MIEKVFPFVDHVYDNFNDDNRDQGGNSYKKTLEKIKEIENHNNYVEKFISNANLMSPSLYGKPFMCDSLIKYLLKKTHPFYQNIDTEVFAMPGKTPIDKFYQYFLKHGYSPKSIIFEGNNCFKSGFEPKLGDLIFTINDKGECTHIVLYMGGYKYSIVNGKVKLLNEELSLNQGGFPTVFHAPGPGKYIGKYPLWPPNKGMKYVAISPKFL